MSDPVSGTTVAAVRTTVMLIPQLLKSPAIARL